MSKLDKISRLIANSKEVVELEKKNKNRKINMLSSYILLSLLGMLLSGYAVADNTPNSSTVSINANPDEAQDVPTSGTNTQAMQLSIEANQQNQQQAVSKGNTFVTTAPDPNNTAYWANKNANNGTEDAEQGQEMKNMTTVPVDQARLEKESQGLKTYLNQWTGQKPAFESVLFDSGNLSKQNGISSGDHAFHPVTALPGTLWYATMANGADSYVPGVVRIQLQEGPFAGGYALGKFQIAPDGKHLILTFNTLSFGNTSFPISAVAIDPQSQVPGVTGDIDHHFMVRYVIPGAMGFLQGAVNLLKANSTVVTNGTTSTVSGPQLSNAQLALLMASSAADRLQDATTPQGVLKLPEVKIAPGAGIGFLLLKSV